MNKQTIKQLLSASALALPLFLGSGAPAQALNQPSTYAAVQQQTLMGHATVRLNLRSGPGIGNAWLLTMPLNQELTLLERNAKGDWLYVQLAPNPALGIGNVTGWVYRPLVKTDDDMTQLPVLEASALPTPIVVTQPPAQPTPTAVPTVTPALQGAPLTINANATAVQANTPLHVTIDHYPIHEYVEVYLSEVDGSKRMTLASGTADSKGLAAFDFNVPGEWSDGRPIVDSNLILTIGSPNHNTQQTLLLHYQVQ